MLHRVSRNTIREWKDRKGASRETRPLFSSLVVRLVTNDCFVIREPDGLRGSKHLVGRKKLRGRKVSIGSFIVQTSSRGKGDRLSPTPNNILRTLALK